MSFEPTAEQRAIVAAIRDTQDSVLIRAYAGCAKTSTVELAAREALSPAVPVLYLVFNSKNKKEAEGRMPPHVTVMTVNALGHRAWQRTVQGKRLQLDDRKLGRLVSAELKASGIANEEDLWTEVRSLVIRAMQVGIVPAARGVAGLIPDTDEEWERLREDASPAAVTVSLARRVLESSIREAFAGTINFDDQVYCSALLGGQFPRYPVVIVDEAQDQSKLNALMIKKTAAGRLIVVGDQKQAIYAWRGADADSMENLKALRPKWIELPLATTFRCAKEMVRRNAAHAPGFTAATSNAEGRFIRLPAANQEGRALGEEPELTWNWDNVVGKLQANATAAVLCRNNAPLLSLAFKLIRAGIGVQVAGREIGKGLAALSKKLDKDDATPLLTHIAHIREWCDRESSIALANDDAGKAESISDRAECLLAVAEGMPAGVTPTAGELHRKLESLFSAEGHRLLLLSSIHRAKGLEWDLVVHLDPWRIPSRFAKGAALEQERNLRYVCETRAKHTLIEANLEDYDDEF